MLLNWANANSILINIPMICWCLFIDVIDSGMRCLHLIVLISDPPFSWSHPSLVKQMTMENILPTVQQRC